MTTEIMNVHQALVELKTLEKRIADGITDVRYVSCSKHSSTKVGGVSTERYVADVRSRYQQLNDLMKRRRAIKQAVIHSNAITEITVGEERMTVAQAIECKNHGLDQHRALLTQLETMLRIETKNADEQNADLDRRADEYIKALFGNSDMKNASDSVKKAREDFLQSQTVELVDPINIRKEIATLEAYVNDFNTAVDAALSVSNALTNIEVTY